MKPWKRLTSNRSGWTLIELMIVVGILVVLTGVAVTVWVPLMAKVHGSRAKADMSVIAEAGINDFAIEEGVWAEYTMGFAGDMPPSFLKKGLLNTWPKAPCPGFYYSWEDYTGTLNITRVTLRNAANNAIWSYCVSALGGVSGNCTDADPDPIFGGTPIEISHGGGDGHLYCNE